MRDDTTLDLIEELHYNVGRKLDSLMVPTKFVSSLRKIIDDWTANVRPHLTEIEYDRKKVEELSFLFQELSDLRNIGRNILAMKDVLSQISDYLQSDFITPIRKRAKE